MLTLIIVCMKGISSVGYGCCVPVLLPLTDYPSWVFRVAWCVVPTLLCLLCTNARHQQYVTQLATVRQDALEAAGTKLIVVGCGDWPLIENYQSTLRPSHATSIYVLIVSQKTPGSRERSTPIQTGSSTTPLTWSQISNGRPRAKKDAAT